MFVTDINAFLLFHRLSLNCIQCEKGHINPSQSLVIRGSCLSCSLDNPQITYRWKLYEVDSFVKGNTWECPSDDHNGRVTLSTTPVTDSKSPSVLQITDSYVEYTFGPCLGNKFQKSGGNKSGLASGSGDGTGNEIKYRSVKAPLKGNETSAIKADDSGDVDDDEVNNDDDDDDSSSYSRSTLPTALSMTDANSVHKPIITTPSFNKPNKPINPSMLWSRRRELRHLGNQTTTGIRNQNLVLLGKFLKGGQTYLATFDVRDLETKQKGLASIIFQTSVSLKCGVCQITPAVGFSLQTTFQLVCSNWRVRLMMKFIQCLLFFLPIFNFIQLFFFFKMSCQRFLCIYNVAGG